MPDHDQLYAALAYVIRRHRLEANLSQAQVYEAAHMTRNVLSRLEENERPFSAVQIRTLAQVFGLEGWQLLREAEEAMEAGDIPKLPASKRAWRRALGFES